MRPVACAFHSPRFCSSATNPSGAASRRVASKNVPTDRGQEERRSRNVRRAEDLAVREMPELRAGVGSSTVRVQAFAVNVTYTELRAGQRHSSQASPPCVPRVDAAGGRSSKR
jgi:hypothetical protein